jgi:hypothetical protein
LPTAPYAMDAVRTIVDNLIWSILRDREEITWPIAP